MTVVRAPRSSNDTITVELTLPLFERVTN